MIVSFFLAAVGPDEDFIERESLTESPFGVATGEEMDEVGGNLEIGITFVADCELFGSSPWVLATDASVA